MTIYLGILSSLPGRELEFDPVPRLYLHSGIPSLAMQLRTACTLERSEVTMRSSPTRAATVFDAPCLVGIYKSSSQQGEIQHVLIQRSCQGSGEFDTVDVNQKHRDLESRIFSHASLSA
jgi:hypothetical protein